MGAGLRYNSFESGDGTVRINTAEFLDMLITCETFTELCVSKLTYLKVDNTFA